MPVVANVIVQLIMRLVQQKMCCSGKRETTPHLSSRFWKMFVIVSNGKCT